MKVHRREKSDPRETSARSDTMPDPVTLVPPGADGARLPRIPAPVAIFVVACLVFGFRLGSEPHFVDESAYIAQSFYADLFLDRKVNDPAWLDYAGFDLPPLPKYLIGVALRLDGTPRPGLAATAAWYGDTSKQFVSESALLTARIPSVLLGAMGCVAIHAIGVRSFGRWAGLIAAGLLMVSPLYRLHARRAMSDVPAEACMLAALAIGLVAWSRFVAGRGDVRAWLAMALGAGALTGLAVLSKLNGAIAGMILGAWALLACLLPRVTGRAKVGVVAATALAGLVAFATFVALNPFLTARPVTPLRPEQTAVAALSFAGRLRLVAEHRVAVSDHAMSLFPHDALPTLPEKLAAVAVQGYGRFSPLGPSHSDSRRRFDRDQDWPVVIWPAIVVVGLVVAVARGRSQLRAGEPPTAWAVVLAAITAFVAVASFIPLAWDRYYLSLQPGAILLASAALTAPFQRLRRHRAGGADPS